MNLNLLRLDLHIFIVKHGLCELVFNNKQIILLVIIANLFAEILWKILFFSNHNFYFP